MVLKILLAISTFCFLILQQQGASTTVYCATAHELSGCTGLYFNNCCRCPPSKPSQDPQMAKLLWDISVEMVERIMGEGSVHY